MFRRTCSFVVSVILLVLAALPNLFAQNRKIMVIAPHEDDEALIGSGVIHAAKLRGDSVKVVLSTNGDYNGGVSTGYLREAQTVSAMTILGLSEQDVIFLGYGDSLLRTLYQSPSDTTIYTSNACMTHTYANRGLGAVDYHTYLTGQPADYTRANILSDFKSILINFQPDEVYTTSYLDGHDDHASTYLFTVEALVDLNRAGMNLHTRVHDSVVWASFDPNNPWPAPGVTPTVPFTEPPSMSAGPYLWTAVEHIAVPADMQNIDLGSNQKYQAIQQYSPNDFENSFTKKDEFFWVHEFPTNLATTATVTVSSEDPVENGMKAVDGVFASSGTDWTGEWITNYEQSGAWIQLSWPQPVTISRVVLYDRPTNFEQILSGTLSFSDGSTIPVGALPDNGSAFPIAFAQKTITSVKFTVDSAVGWAPTGLNEIEVYGFPAGSTTNHAPQITSGPVAAQPDLSGLQTTIIAVDAYDLDGDALLYQWTSDIGTINGTGANVTFVAPLVSADTYATINVTISDGRGGTVTNTTFVGVHPSPVKVQALTFAPSAVQGGQTATGTVTLNSPAPSAGAVITLSENNAAVNVPVSVTVPAGSNAATFTATTTPVVANTPVNITASFNESTASAQLSVTPPTLTGLTLNPTSVIGGNSSTVTIQISGAAPSGGITVALVSSNPGVANVPANVTIPIGATSATFSVTTAAVVASATARIGASFGTFTQNTTLTILPVAVSAFSVSPSALIGGNSSTGTITLNGSTITNTVVNLSSLYHLALLPATVTVPAGQTSVSFTITTKGVLQNTVETVYATYAGVSKTANMNIKPADISSLTLTPSSVKGGTSATGTVVLTGAIPTNGTITLSSSNTAAASVPGSIAGNGTNTITFTITTYASTTTRTSTISAQYVKSGVSKTLTVTP